MVDLDFLIKKQIQMCDYSWHLIIFGFWNINIFPE